MVTFLCLNIEKENERMTDPKNLIKISPASGLEDDFVNVAYQFGGISLVVDKRIKSYLFEYAVRFFTLALSCCKDLPDERPKMAEVAKELEYIDFMLLEPDSKRTEYVTSDSSMEDDRDEDDKAKDGRENVAEELLPLVMVVATVLGHGWMGMSVDWSPSPPTIPTTASYTKLEAYASYCGQQVSLTTAVWSPFLYDSAVPVSPFMFEILQQDKTSKGVLVNVN
ncbi:hypothetical protein ACSQ67_017456 [Phaseolus vulgaris]